MDIEALIKNPTVKKAFWAVFGVGVALVVIRIIMQVMFFSQMTNFVTGQRDRMEAFHDEMRRESHLMDQEMRRGMDEMNNGADDMKKRFAAFQKEFSEGARKVEDDMRRFPAEMKEFRDENTKYISNDIKKTSIKILKKEQHFYDHELNPKNPEHKKWIKEWYAKKKPILDQLEREVKEYEAR